MLLEDLNTLSSLETEVELVTYEITSEFRDLIPKHVTVFQLKYGIISLLMHYIKKDCAIWSSSGLADLTLLSFFKTIKLTILDHHPTSLMPNGTFPDLECIQSLIYEFWSANTIKVYPRLNLVKIISLKGMKYSLHKRAYELAERIIVLSDYGKKEKLFMYGKDALIVKTGADLLPGILFENDLEDFVCTQRLVEGKNLLTLLNAVLRLRGTVFKDRKLHIIGDGPLREEICRFVQKHELNSTVILHGFLSVEQKTLLLSKCRYFVNPQFADYNLTTIEALRLGCRVVTSSIVDVTPSSERFMVRCDQRSVSALIKAIKKVVMLSDADAEMTNLLLTDLNQQYSWETRSNMIKNIANE